MGVRVEGTVVPGHGVASGTVADPRFPDGTIALQLRHFADRGLDLSRFHPATINVSIAPRRYRVIAPRYTFRDVCWSPSVAPEDFSFFDCRISVDGETFCEAVIYRPHPETKPGHPQPPDVLEIITVELEGLSYGDRVTLEVDPEQIAVV